MILDLQLSKVNFNGPIMQLEQIFGTIVSISDCCYLKIMWSKVISRFIYNQLIYTRSTQTMKKGPKITFFLNNSTLLKNYWIGFCSFSNLSPGMVQLRYQRPKRLKFHSSSLDV